jgi:diadenosine tetraphosphate (Ap4A) HIT family hydrolase
MGLKLPEVESCVFCDQIALPSEARRPGMWAVLEETDLTVAVLAITQFEVGQSLVIPRRHAATLLDLTDAEAHAIMDSARRVMQATVEALAPLGVLLYQNNGVYSGQEVPHFHLHVVPRSPGSDWGVGPRQLAKLEEAHRPSRLLPSPEQLMDTASKIRARLT